MKAAAGEQASFEVDSMLEWNASGIEVGRGERCDLRAAVMTAAARLAACAAIAACGCASPEASQVSVATPNAPIWSDEFDGPAGQSADPRKWVLETGGGGWGNNELQYYTSRPANAALDGQGHLVIQALQETFTGPDGVTRRYTSARLKTQGLFEQSYGRFEARIRIPFGQGLWPAFWMLGADIPTAGWPGCGEIDILENIGREPRTVHGTLHGPGYAGDASIGAAYSLPSGERFADALHVYAIEWDPGAVRFYVDGALYQSRGPADLPRGAPWVFDHPFFMLLNVAVGGNWPGPPDETTAFPQTMLVDYVRVFRLAGRAN